MADRSVSVWLRADVSGYLASIQKAKLSTADFAKSAQRDAKVHSASMDKVGKGMLVTGGVIAAGFALAIKASMAFRAQMAQVQSLSGASSTEMKKLADAALTVGQRFGFTATQVAEAETELVKAGLSVKDILGGALTGALTLAADGQMNVADATQIAVSAMTQFKLTGKDVPHIADLLAAGADKALGSVGDLGEGLSSSGTVAHQFGWSLQETVGTLAEFAQNAQIGEKGGTLLRQTLLRLVGAQGVAKAMMDKYGFSVTGANGQMVSSSELAGRLQKSFGGLTPAVRNHALAVIFGTHAIQGANILMSDGAKVNAGWVTSVNDAGFAAKQASGKMDSLSGDLSKLKASFETGLIRTGDEATGTLRGLVHGLTAVSTWYNNLSDSSRSLVTEAALVAGGLTLVGGAALVALPKIVAFKAALADLGFTSGKVIPPLVGTAGAESAVGAGGTGGAARGLLGGVGALGPLGLVAGGTAALFLTMGDAAGQDDRDFQKQVAALAGNPKALAQQQAKLRALQAQQARQQAAGPGLGTGGQTVSLGGKTFSTGAHAAGSSAIGVQITDLQKLTTAAAAAAGGQTQVVTAAQKTAAAAAAAAQSITDWSAALKSTNQPALDARGAARDYQAAIDAVTASMKQNGHSLDTNTDKGRANQQALDAVAAAANASAAANRANGASLPKVNAQLSVARGQLYDMARKFGMGKDAAHAYVNEVLGIPGQASTQITLAGIKAAKKAAHDLKIWLQGELGVINIQAKVRNSVGKGAPKGSATGGYITGPGTATSDSIPAWLSNGEFVINAASVARIGVENLHALNRYAGGGMVGQPSTQPMGAWSMPDTITLVDSDGTFIARMRAEAGGVTRKALYAEARAYAGRSR